jgi:hypothetical protein
MTKKSPEHFCNYLRVLAATVSYAETSRTLGDDQSLIYRWLNESKAASATPDVPSVFRFEFEGETKFLHEFVRACITSSIEAIEAAARSRALRGTYTVAKFQGRTVYQIDPDLEELGFSGPEAYKRDPGTGEPKPELVWTPPSTDLVMGILAAHSKRYRKQTSISMDVNNRVSGGVMIVGGGSRPAMQNIAPPLPFLEIIEDAEAEPVRADDPAPAHDDEPEDEQPIPPERVQPEERTIREATPANYQPTPSPSPLSPTQSERTFRPLSDLERDLLSRARGTPEQRSAPIVFPTKVNRG